MFSLSRKFPASPRGTCADELAGSYSGCEGETPSRQPAGRRRYLKQKKENRAGWPGFFCVELDAVTSQRGATGAEVAFVLLRRESTDRKDLSRQVNRLESACKPHAMHLSVSVLDHKLLFLINLDGQRIRGRCPLLITYGGCDSKVLHNLHREDMHSESAWRIRRTAEAAVPTFTTTHISLRPSMAFSIVISSVYSMSLPTGIPIAMRVILTPARLSCCER